MPHIGLIAKEVEEKYTSFEVADNLELEDFIRLDDDKLYNMGMQVVRQILHEMAVAGGTRRAGPAIPEEASGQTPAATPAARSGTAATPDVTAAVKHMTTMTTPPCRRRRPPPPPAQAQWPKAKGVHGFERRRIHRGAGSSRSPS